MFEPFVADAATQEADDFAVLGDGIGAVRVGLEFGDGVLHAAGGIERGDAARHDIARGGVAGGFGDGGDAF